MNVRPGSLEGLLIVEPEVHRDARGRFLETWSAGRYTKGGLPQLFVQDNVSVSGQGVIRGLHFQHPRAQGKLVSVLKGSVYDVAVDIRRDSPTFGHWAGFELSGERPRQVYIPKGFAHGFAVTSPEAIVFYKCTEYYRKKDEGVIRWDDPEIGIHWPVSDPILSEKDARAPTLAECERLP